MDRWRLGGITLIVLGIALLVSLIFIIPAFPAPVCTTDATTGKVTCKEDVSIGTSTDPLFEFTGQVKNPLTGQKLVFDKWVMPVCGPIIHKVSGTTFSIELTCEGGFTITWTLTQKR